MGLPGHGDRRAVQPAADLRVPVQVDRRQLQGLRPGEPAVRRRDDDDRPGQRRSRTSSARRPATRTATSTGSPSSTTRRSRSTPWAPQDGWNHKVLIHHGASCGIERQAGSAPDVMDDAALSPRLRGDVDRAQQRGPQLQHRHAGRVAGHGQGADRRAVRADPLHDRHRLLGRLAHPAAGRQRLPRHLPGHPAGLLVPRRVVDRPAARRLQPRAPATSRTRRSGRPASCGTRSRSARSRATRTTSTRSSSTPSTGPTSACRTTAAPASPTTRSTTPRRTRAASAARSPTT